MRDFLVRLTSRKFLLAVSGLAAAVANRRFDLAVGVVISYITAEGAADYKSRGATVKA